MFLEKIESPADLKALSAEDRRALVEEMHAALLKRASIHGGHFRPVFGIVEATVALHTVLDSPKDKFVFDVSHQSYAHKMLTGRKDAYLYEKHYDDVSGYTNPEVCRTDGDISSEEDEGGKAPRRHHGLRAARDRLHARAPQGGGQPVHRCWHRRGARRRARQGEPSDARTDRSRRHGIARLIYRRIAYRKNERKTPARQVAGVFRSYGHARRR